MMRVFVSGASGAIGAYLVPQLIEHGHEVIGTYTSSPAKAAQLRALGAEPVQLNVLDAAAVLAAVRDAKPAPGLRRGLLGGIACWGARTTSEAPPATGLR